jgi:hypothetical protein
MNFVQARKSRRCGQAEGQAAADTRADQQPEQHQPLPGQATRCRDSQRLGTQVGINYFTDMCVQYTRQSRSLNLYIHPQVKPIQYCSTKFLLSFIILESFVYILFEAVYFKEYNLILIEYPRKRIS